MSKSFSESDMFEPVKLYFENMGYSVNSEVKSVDMTAVKDDTIVVAEFKTSFCLKLVYQLADRQKITENVYAVIPRPSRQKGTAWRNCVNLLKRLGCGLITVSMDSPVKSCEIILEPHGIIKTNSKRQSKIKTEISSRSSDYNKAGTNKTKIITAYREKNIELGCLLYMAKEISVKELASLGFDSKYISILQKNYYGWFKRVSKGVYSLSEKGSSELKDEKYSNLIKYYTENHINTIDKIKNSTI